MELDNFEPLLIPDAYALAIGRIALSSSALEDVVEDAIAGLAGVDIERGFALTSHMSAHMREDVIRSLAEIAIDDLNHLDELDQILLKTRTANQKRNAYLHNEFGIDKNTGDVGMIKVSARGSVKAEIIPISINTIEADVKLINDARNDIIEFFITKNLFMPLPSSIPSRSHKSKAARKARKK